MRKSLSVPLIKSLWGNFIDRINPFHLLTVRLHTLKDAAATKTVML